MLKNLLGREPADGRMRDGSPDELFDEVPDIRVAVQVMSVESERLRRINSPTPPVSQLRPDAADHRARTDERGPTAPT
jgi:hypothetical protein